MDSDVDRKVPHFKNMALGSTELKLTWDTDNKAVSENDEEVSDSDKLDEEDMKTLRQAMV